MAAKTILLVDDSPTERKSMQQALQGHGYTLVPPATARRPGKGLTAKTRSDPARRDSAEENGFQVAGS